MNLKRVRIRNFKAIIDSKSLRLGPLTVFIGNNGVGKSSLIEALETWQSIVRDGLDVAMQRWLGIEHARHKAQEAREHKGQMVNPISFEMALGRGKGKACRIQLAISNDPAANRMFIADERISTGAAWSVRDQPGAAQTYGPGRSMLSAPLPEFADEVRHILDWQFLSMNPERMGLPVPQQRTAGGVRLARDASNVADFLLDIRRQSPAAFDGIAETMAHILPYAKDIQASLTSSDIERKAWLQLTEANFKVPGWMLSSGTLRILALLALLRHPVPPPLIVVEEIENGLDPRSIHLIVEEIRHAVLNGTTQVILTTHSPYLLDLFLLEHLVLVERDATGHPRFYRPADNANLQGWSQDFAPGKLYTMGTLTEAKS